VHTASAKLTAVEQSEEPVGVFRPGLGQWKSIDLSETTQHIVAGVPR
jgi:hypothetical protein